jgi:hypothetical protein
MNAVAMTLDDTRRPVYGESFDPESLPPALVKQCRDLIHNHHKLHGYNCLADILWKSQLGPFIQTSRVLRQLLRKASTTRSAKTSNESFALIATTMISLEILGSGFAGWSIIYPEAASVARALLRRNRLGYHTPLLEFYLHPPKYVSYPAVATLALTEAKQQTGEIDMDRMSKPSSLLDAQ